jgi:hypothetical protein
MKRILEIGGLAAGVAMVAIGIVAIVMGFSGHSTVVDSIKLEKIVGSADMNPTDIRAGGKEAGLPETTNYPDCDVAGKPIDSGERARCFAEYLRIHALESTGGKVYAEMGRFLKEDGTDTSNAEEAAKNPETGRPVENGMRNLWITATSLSTALNTSYLAEQIALFGIVVGIALLLSGLGFMVLAWYTLGGALMRRKGSAA